MLCRRHDSRSWKTTRTMVHVICTGHIQLSMPRGKKFGETVVWTRRGKTLLQGHRLNSADRLNSLQWAAWWFSEKWWWTPPWVRKTREKQLQLLWVTTSKNIKGSVDLYLWSFYFCLVTPSPFVFSSHEAHLCSSHEKGSPLYKVKTCDCHVSYYLMITESQEHRMT